MRAFLNIKKNSTLVQAVFYKTTFVSYLLTIKNK